MNEKIVWDVIRVGPGRENSMGAYEWKRLAGVRRATTRFND